MMIHAKRAVRRASTIRLWTAAVVLGLGFGCANLDPATLQMGTALLTAVGQNFGGKYYDEVKQFYDTMNAASNNALAQILVPGSLPGGPPSDPSAVQDYALADGDADDDAWAAGDDPNESMLSTGDDSGMGVSDMNTGMGSEMDMGGGMDSDMSMDAAVESGMDTGMDSEMDMGDMSAQSMPEADANATLMLDVAVMKRIVDANGDRVVALDNGDVIVDGNGDPNAGDQLQVFFRPNVDAWVYVVAVDATGWVQPMFPNAFPDTQNPRPAGSTTLIPGENYWFGLDEYKGTEHIYFLASLGPRADLEAQLAAFASMERPATPDPVPVGVPAVVEEAFIQARGFTGIRPGESTTYDAQPTRFSFGVPGADLVITRYFEHR